MLINPGTPLRTIVMNDGMIGHNGGPPMPSFAALVAQLFASGAPGAAWDFTDPARLWTDTAGTSPALLGDYAARVDDLTGRGQHLLQGSLPSRPQRALLPNGLPSLFFDGADDFLTLSSLDLTTTDKVTVFAGFRRLDNRVAIIAAHGASLGSTQSWAVQKPSPAETSNLLFRSRGAGAETFAVLTTPAPPHSAVLTSQSDLGTPLLTVRVNGATASSSASQGAGPYGNAALFVGRNISASLPLYGYLLYLIILGRIATANEIAAMDATGAGLLGVTL